MGKTQSVGCDCQAKNPKDKYDECLCTNSYDIPRDANPPVQWICGSCQGNNHRWLTY